MSDVVTSRKRTTTRSPVPEKDKKCKTLSILDCIEQQVQDIDERSIDDPEELQKVQRIREVLFGHPIESSDSATYAAFASPSTLLPQNLPSPSETELIGDKGLIPNREVIKRPGYTCPGANTSRSFRRHGLAGIIEAKLERTVSTNQKFLPQHELKRIVTRDTIGRELQDVFVEEPRDELIDYVAKHAPKTLATLTYCGLTHKAIDLLSKGFKDEYLPLYLSGQHTLSYRGLPLDHPALEWLRDWRQEDAKAFCESQWVFQPMSLQSVHDIEELFPSSPLPFISSVPMTSSSRYGVVHKVVLHPTDCPATIKNLNIAVKQIGGLGLGKEEEEKIEIDALHVAKRLDHPHMVKLIGAYKQNSSSYMMYEWAEGGNLREFWDDNRNWALNGAIVQWSFKQMLGLATALRMWHKYYPHSHKVGWHGDLKPENILHFRDDSRGVFKIDDFGHARLHALPTHTRNTVSVSLIDSIRYRPPEVQLGRTQAASRSYDMWSIGCVYLEWIIWLCYGREVLYKFQKQVFSDNIDGFFTQKDEGWIVHPIVERWMDHMQNTCSGAIRQLLLFIRGGLLVAATQESVTRSAKLMALDSARASIDDLCQTLEAISELSERNSNYLYDPNVVMYTPEFQDVHQSRKHIPWTPTSQLYPQKKARTSLRRQLNHQIGNNNRYMTPTSVDVWNQEPDNAFAKSVFGTLRRTEISLLAPMHPVSTSLCGNCSSNENSLLSQRPFSISYQKSKVSQSDCIVCAILHDKMADMPGEDCGKAVMREESSLITTTGNLPVFSIIAGPTHDLSSVPDSIQRGFPILPIPGSDIHLRLLKRWVEDCDCNHRCRPRNVSMPLRLIDLTVRSDCAGHADPNMLRLDCSHTRMTNEYAALSHRWGDAGPEDRFRLTNESLGAWQDHLDFTTLPRTFQDAVMVARGLGIQYLWIDTLCIKQDDSVDLGIQVREMEDIFACAYITISATCATSDTDGFLKKRQSQRGCHALHIPDGTGKLQTVYLCDSIDDFKRDVEESDLSERGWVFQERVLSRRIIHFTSEQTYWECGSGVRCETLTKLQNHKTSFLSDPEFPRSIEQYRKEFRHGDFQERYEKYWMPMVFIQDMYKKYSQLAFTHHSDRSIGIAGIETRLAKVFVNAQYGVVHDPKETTYLPRCLLWCRANDKDTLQQIRYPQGRSAPSWSWMSVMGPVRYMHVPYADVQWYSDLMFVFDSPQTYRQHVAMDQQSQCLHGTARHFDKQPADQVVFDTSDAVPEYVSLKCLVLGEKLVSKKPLVKHYGLLVVAVEDDRVYRRVGVASFKRARHWILQAGTPVIVI